MIDRRTFTKAVGLGAGTTALSLTALPQAAEAVPGEVALTAPAAPAVSVASAASAVEAAPGTPVVRGGFARTAHIRAGLLDVGYAEDGPADGPAVICLHGWPYDIHSYTDVAPLLAARPKTAVPTVALVSSRDPFAVPGYHDFFT
ncbi:hypothetical protein [Kitasatospora brasiliensis]|uniref:hypothetical protein n=1 Tax=Kitasatospora brasiliensis TaxID=3058040 RepID=UPI00292E1ADD|nr:hypothetical protein [Kitasatospora sp. K002]